MLPNPSILINALVRKEAKASCEIENIITTDDKLYRALSLIGTNGILQIQLELEQNQAGIRRPPGTSLGNDRTNQVIYTPPDDPSVLNELMHNLEDYFNTNEPNDVSTLIKLAIQHYQFESIHTFYDGNGSAGRIINVLYLLLHDLVTEPILYLSGYIIEHKADYYRLLQAVRTQQN